MYSKTLFVLLCLWYGPWVRNKISIFLLFSFFALRVLAKRYHFAANRPTTLYESKDGIHLFTLKFECHHWYNKLILCNSEICDIAWCNKNNAKWGFYVSFFKKNNNLLLFRINKKIGLKKLVGCSFLMFFLNPDCLSILFETLP